MNHGMDLGVPAGTPIVAPIDGKVTLVVKAGTKDYGYGNSVTIQDSDGVYHRFSHMQNPSVYKEGATVKQGAVLGTVGQTGNATGPHLDYEAWRVGKNGMKEFFDASSLYPDKAAVTQATTSTPGGASTLARSNAFLPAGDMSDPSTISSPLPARVAPSSSRTNDYSGNETRDMAGSAVRRTGVAPTTPTPEVEITSAQALKEAALAARSSLIELQQQYEAETNPARKAYIQELMGGAQEEYSQSAKAWSDAERLSTTGANKPSVVSASASGKEDKWIITIKGDGTVEKTLNENYVEGYDPAGDALRQRQQEAILSATTQRYVADLQDAARASDLEWDKEKALIQAAFEERRLTFDEARLAAEERHREIMAGLEASQQALAQRRDEISLRGQDLEAGITQRGQDITTRGQDMDQANTRLRTGSDLMQQGLSSGVSAGNAALGAATAMLPFTAAPGSSARLDQMIAAQGRGDTAAIGALPPAPTMGMPFDPATFGVGVTRNVMGMVEPRANELMNAGFVAPGAAPPTVPLPATPPPVPMGGGFGGFIAPFRIRRVI